MDNTIKSITSATLHKVNGLQKVSATYTEISEEGQTIKDNVRFNLFIMDEEVQGHVDAINEFLATKIPIE